MIRAAFKTLRQAMAAADTPLVFETVRNAAERLLHYSAMDRVSQIATAHALPDKISGLAGKGLLRNGDRRC